MDAEPSYVELPGGRFRLVDLSVPLEHQASGT